MEEKLMSRIDTTLKTVAALVLIPAIFSVWELWVCVLMIPAVRNGDDINWWLGLMPIYQLKQLFTYP